VWTIPDEDFALLLERVVDLHLCYAEALLYVAQDGGAVDVRRIAKHCGVCRAEATAYMRHLAMQGLAKKDGQKWRFAFRGARRE
jgi:Mn-dependent DtxR family transcriptional regulator